MRWVMYKGSIEGRLEVWLVHLKFSWKRQIPEDRTSGNRAVFEHRPMTGSQEGKLSMEE